MIQKHPALIEFRDDSISYSIEDLIAWQLPLSAVRVIGESTMDHGPFLDDYFFCFATDADTCYVVSFYSEGRDALLKALSERLQAEIRFTLLGSTDFDSNVVWPPHLAGSPMYTYEPAHATTWYGRLIEAWFGPSRNTQWFSEVVLSELKKSETQFELADLRSSVR